MGSFSWVEGELQGTLSSLAARPMRGNGGAPVSTRAENPTNAKGAALVRGP
jgi:hypothetical protein